MYLWLVFVHVLATFGFLGAHGVSAAVSLRLRYVREIDEARTLLNLSSYALPVMYVSLLLLLGTGIWAGFEGHWWRSGWIWVSLGLLITMVVSMWAIASPYYLSVRRAAGLPVLYGPDKGPAQPPDEEELLALLSSPRPLIIAAIGIVGLLAILWLMVLKPF